MNIKDKIPTAIRIGPGNNAENLILNIIQEYTD
jgi:hypothetical protein